MLRLNDDGSQVRFEKTLWVHFGGVEQREEGEELLLIGRDEDSYLKVLNHFGRVLKLYTFENGRWMDGETGAPPGPLDESLAGRIPSAGQPSSEGKAPPKPAQKAAALKKRAGSTPKPGPSRAAAQKSVPKKAPQKTASGKSPSRKTT